MTGSRGRYITLTRYILFEFLFSFLVSFLFYFIVFFLNQILLLAQGILAKGIPVKSVLLLILYSIPSFITLSAPFAALTASLMTYGYFASGNEILAMRSAGLKRFTIFKPVLIAGIIISLFSFGINDIFLPAGTRAFQRLWIKLSLTYPGLELEAYSVRNFKNSVLVTGEIDKLGIHPLVIINRTNSGNRETIISSLASPDIKGKEGDFPGFSMSNILSITPDSQKRDKWTWTKADSMEYRLLTGSSGISDRVSNPANMKVSEIKKVIKDKSSRQNIRQAEYNKTVEQLKFLLALEYNNLIYGGPAEFYSGYSETANKGSRLANIINNPPADHSLQIWKLEYYQKFAIPFSAIPFVLLAYSLGLSAGKSGRAVGFFIGLLISVFYWSLLVLGRSLGLRTDISPFIVMILPDIVLFIIALVLYFRKN